MTNEHPANAGSSEETIVSEMEAKLFGESTEPKEPEAVLEGDDTSEDETTEAEGEQATEETPQASPEEEVEYDGKTYKVAPELKQALLRQSDYTQKTQSLAEEKRHLALNVQKQQIESLIFNAVKGKVAELEAVKAAIEPYTKLDMRALDADQRRAVLDELTILERRERSLQGEIDQVRSKTEGELRNLRQQAVNSAYEILNKRVPGFAPGSQIETETARYAASIGIPPEQFVEATLFNPGFAVLAAQAAKYAQLQSKKGPALQSANKAPPVVKPGSVNAEMQARMKDLNLRKQIKQAKSPYEKERLIQQGLESRFFR